MVTLRTILAAPGLGLRLVGGDRNVDVDVRWAHVSELDDPTPWLEGGELLLTTGLSASWDGDGARDYCRRLLERGVVALGVSVGPDLAYPEIPAALCAAAEETGLRLVLVPQLTPLQSVVRAVADSISVVSMQPLRSLLDTQQRLMAEAASGSGLQGAVDRLRLIAGLEVAVYDVRLRPVASGQSGRDELGPELRRRIRKQMLRDVQGSLSIHGEDRSDISLPLVSEGTVRGFVVAGQSRPFTADERSLLKVSVPLLALLLELRHGADAGVRRARAQLARLLLGGGDASEQIPGALAAAQLTTTTTRVIRARMQSMAQRRAFVAGLTELGADALVQNDDAHTTIVVCDPAPDLVERLTELVEELGMTDVGVGEPAVVEHTARSHTEAVRAQNAARARGTALATAPDNGGRLLDVLLDDAARLTEFSDSVLRPIDAHDQANRRHELLPTLQAYFDSIASIEAAAAMLQIHRHTTRARLRRASEISGYDISDASQYLELWLAVELRRRSSQH